MLLASFYVESNYRISSANVTCGINARNALNTGWLTTNANHFTSSVAELASVVENDETVYRARVDVSLATATAGHSAYVLHVAGTYWYRVQVSASFSYQGNTVSRPLAERFLYVTIQPDVQVSRSVGGKTVVLLETTATTHSANPLDQTKTVKLTDTSDPDVLGARTVLLDGSNSYQGTVSVKSNAPVDAYCNDFIANDGLRIHDKLNVTRTITAIGTPTIQTDSQTQDKYVNFILNSGNLLRDTVALGFGKRLLAIPLHFQSALSLHFRPTSRYKNTDINTSTGTGIVASMPPLPLSVELKTLPHTLKITPPVVTLEEYNNYTSFVTVDTNDDAPWIIAPNNPQSITVTPSSGTGRAAVVVKTVSSFDWGNKNFHEIGLTATSTVGPSTVMATSKVHVERYTPTRNALIPKMESGTRDDVTVKHIYNDTANELTGTNAVFAITSEEEHLFIDTGEPQLLTRITLRGQNIRRRLTTNLYKGGAAAAFTIEGRNDPDDSWSMWRDGSSVTDFTANVATTTITIGRWNTPGSTSVDINRTGTATEYRYYRIVPINRSTDGRELSFVFTSDGTNRAVTLRPTNTTSLPTSSFSIASTPPPLSTCAWEAFDHSLTLRGFAGRFTTNLYSTGTTLAAANGVLNPQALRNLDQYPTVEVDFDTPHRIRSWSMQSVGESVFDSAFESHATVLVLQGRTLDGTWKILDLARSPYTATSIPDFVHADKKRVDRQVLLVEIVDALRISAVAVRWAASGITAYGTVNTGGYVWFPQIQVFAGEPVLPRMTASSVNNVTVNSDGANNGRFVFDREVSGTDIASVGSRQWYMNADRDLWNDVAKSGSLRHVYQGDYESHCWLSLMFPAARILGYLYSIDNLRDRSDNHANTSYAASLFFEGRETADATFIKSPSQGNWTFIDLLSLDRCIGDNDFGMPTPRLIAELDQATLNTYAQNLGLPVIDRTFLTNNFDLHMIRYDGTEGKWYDDGFRLAPGTTGTASDQFHNMTTLELLEEAGQLRLNSVALSRSSYLNPPIIPDKASIVNQRDEKRMIYDLTSGTWEEVPNHDAIYHVHDRTHYTDLKDLQGDFLTLAHLRFTIKSIMNTERPANAGGLVAMPEMQFFSLPTGVINKTSTATVAYLKAEDAAGNLHDILGRHVNLPHRTAWANSTNSFRFYVGKAEGIATSGTYANRLYLAWQNTSGTMTAAVNITISTSAGIIVTLPRTASFDCVIFGRY